MNNKTMHHIIASAKQRLWMQSLMRGWAYVYTQQMNMVNEKQWSQYDDNYMEATIQVKEEY